MSQSGNAESPIGCTRTLPLLLARGKWRMAFASCSNYPYGYFTNANDAWRDGAENHNPENGEGEWVIRRRNAVRAYNEYVPIRSGLTYDDRIYRHFRIGNLADLIMLDSGTAIVRRASGCIGT